MSLTRKPHLLDGGADKAPRLHAQTAMIERDSYIYQQRLTGFIMLLRLQSFQDSGSATKEYAVSEPGYLRDAKS